MPIFIQELVQDDIDTLSSARSCHGFPGGREYHTFPQSFEGTSLLCAVSDSMRQNPEGRECSRCKSAVRSPEGGGTQEKHFAARKKDVFKNVSFPSPSNQLVIGQTENVFVAANVVLMETTIEARSEIEPPQDRDVSTQFRKTSGTPTSGVQALRKSIGTAK